MYQLKWSTYGSGERIPTDREKERKQKDFFVPEIFYLLMRGRETERERAIYVFSVFLDAFFSSSK